MSTMQTYTFTGEELEECLDVAKLTLLQALVRDGKMEQEAADQWAKDHTIVRRSKGFFRTLSDLFAKEKADPERDCILIVKRV